MAVAELLPRTQNAALLAAISREPFGTRPFAHQIDGVAQLVEHAAWLLAWDMGLGKTAVVAYRLAIGYRNQHFAGPVLIVCPKSVLTVWPAELARHANLDCVVLAGDKAERAAILRRVTSESIVITNYEQCRLERDALAKLGFDVVVCDESHRIKSSRTQTNKAIRKIAKKSRMRWALSGTPAPNGPLDIFGTLAFIDARVCGDNWYSFRARYGVCGGYANKQIVAYQNLDELEQKVATRSSRLLKEQALDLPEKVFVTRPCALSTPARKIYDALRKESLAKLESARGQGVLTIANVLTESLRLLQVAGGFVSDDDGTLHAIEPNTKLDLLADLIEDIGQQQVVIWAGFVAEVKAIARLLTGAVVHHGGLSLDERRESLAAFKSGSAQYFVATPQSAREGLTLTEASLTIFYSRTYNLLDWSQAQDRLHRIGQQNRVTILSLTAERTIDEKVAKALEKKASLQELILSGAASLGDLL